MNTKHSKQWFFAIAAAAFLLVGLSLFLWKTGALHSLKSVSDLRDFLADSAPWSHLVFFLLQLSSVIIAPIPSNLPAMAGGAGFGLGWGFLLTFLAVNIGSLITFSLARTLLHDWAMGVASRKLPPKYQDLIGRKRDSFLVMVFLFPFFPDDLICILAGLTDIPHRRFALIVLLTRHWGLFVASAMGASLFSLPTWALPLVALVGGGAVRDGAALRGQDSGLGAGAVSAQLAMCNFALRS
ncbi:MAG: VTT domain-containing protein [Clostridiales bacterium]|nr:VTT domain-containing protein [Clostridiales bacterium]